MNYLTIIYKFDKPNHEDPDVKTFILSSLLLHKDNVFVFASPYEAFNFLLSTVDTKYSDFINDLSPRNIKDFITFSTNKHIYRIEPLLVLQ